MAYLTIEIDQKVIAERELADSVVVGRSPDCDLHVPSKFLSRRHLRIERVAQRWLAVDLGSTNGSTIDGQPIATQFLDDGDEVYVKNVRLIFRNPTAVSDLSDDPAPDRISENEIADILNERDDDSVDELPPELARETPSHQVDELPGELTFGAQVEQKTPTPRPARAPDVAPARQERARNLWEMATLPTPSQAKPAIVVADPHSIARPGQKVEQRDLRSLWANVQSNPRSKPVGIAVGLAASVALIVGYLSMGAGSSPPQYDMHPRSVVPAHATGRDPLADIPV